jgi:hypothetical protein
MRNSRCTTTLTPASVAVNIALCQHREDVQCAGCGGAAPAGSAQQAVWTRGSTAIRHANGPVEREARPFGRRDPSAERGRSRHQPPAAGDRLTQHAGDPAAGPRQSLCGTTSYSPGRRRHQPACRAWRWGDPAAAAPTTPARPQTVPEGSAYSPSRKMWRDPPGNVYDATGARANP